IYVSLSFSESTSDGKKSANKERAATVIQSAWRRYKNRAIKELEKAASIIQGAWWTYKVTKLRKVVMENAAAIIQAAWRIYQHKKILEAREMEKAAKCIQYAWRHFQCKKQRIAQVKFLERTPQLRLGYQKGCFPSPMHEPFFSDVEWGKIFNKELNPPFVPLLQSVDPFPDDSSKSNLSIPGNSYFPPID
ncbi:hypothetical protein P5673_031552, partial [Acropora cervicornis]